MTAPTRECLGCGGSGYYTGQCPLEERSREDYCSCSDHPCRACTGSGRITDPTPKEIARDARVDAETLRRIAYDQPLESPAGQPSDFGSLRCAVDDGLPWAGPHYHGHERLLADDALWAARAAFRAVPALKG